jgi:hypothetical protein
MTEFVKAWQCIGCGRIDAPQNCVGICQDRKVEFVYAFEFEEVSVQLKHARRQLHALESLVSQVAWTKPHAGEWESSFRALQKRARQVLAATGGSAAAAE